jgi:hypothetical protein
VAGGAVGMGPQVRRGPTGLQPERERLRASEKDGDRSWEGREDGPDGPPVRARASTREREGRRQVVGGA